MSDTEWSDTEWTDTEWLDNQIANLSCYMLFTPQKEGFLDCGISVKLLKEYKEKWFEKLDRNYTAKVWYNEREDKPLNIDFDIDLSPYP